MRSGTRTSETVVAKHLRGRGPGGHEGEYEKRRTHVSLRETLQNSGMPKPFYQVNLRNIFKNGCRKPTRRWRGMRRHTEARNSFGCESWSWSRAGMDKIEGWETKMTRRFFSLF